MLLRHQKLDATPHGFRSTFLEWASEHTNYPRDLAEVAEALPTAEQTAFDLIDQFEELWLSVQRETSD